MSRVPIFCLKRIQLSIDKCIFVVLYLVIHDENIFLSARHLVIYYEFLLWVSRSRFYAESYSKIIWSFSGTYRLPLFGSQGGIRLKRLINLTNFQIESRINQVDNWTNQLHITEAQNQALRWAASLFKISPISPKMENRFFPTLPESSSHPIQKSLYAFIFMVCVTRCSERVENIMQRHDHFRILSGAIVLAETLGFGNQFDESEILISNQIAALIYCT